MNVSNHAWTMDRHVEAAIFDLDGVLVDTARLHFEAWQRLASKLGFDFTESDNECLKGVSREQSLAILLEVGDLKLSAAERALLAEKKNSWYVERLSLLDESDLLPGALNCLIALRTLRVPAALASSSRNAGTILSQLRLATFFDVVVDGNCISRAKPDPDLFLLAAKALHKEPAACAVFEDAPAGIDAALAAGMFAVGVGSRSTLGAAHIVIPDLAHFDAADLFVCGERRKGRPC